MIKIGTRHNLLYPMMFIIFTGIRKIDSIMMKEISKFSGSLFLTLIMFIADFISGIIIYSYQLKFLNEKEKEITKFMGIELIRAQTEIYPPDSDSRIYLLLFFASFLDFSEYFISSYYIPEKIKYVSISLEWRLKSIIICASALFSYYLLKFQIFKHQKLSIITILICLIIIILTEIIEFYKNRRNEKGISHIIKVLLLMLINHIFNSFLDVIEKYLLEYDFLNPFRILMLEGFFGFFYLYFFHFFKIFLNN